MVLSMLGLAMTALLGCDGRRFDAVAAVLRSVSTAMSRTASPVLATTPRRDQNVLSGLLTVATEGVTEGMVQRPCGRRCGVVMVGGFIVVAVVAEVVLPMRCGRSC